MALKNKKSVNFSDWYTEVVTKSEFVDYTAVSGCVVFRPLAYAVWEKIVAECDKRFKKSGVKNVAFPMLIPENLLKKEATHFEGFVPEVAWVTHTGQSKLDERLAVRPTSEAIVYDSYAKWIRSWRDLPMRYNLWNSILRWEFKHATPLLRSREFLWNEGHTAFATREEAEAEQDIILSIYEEVCKDFMALPCIAGRKTEKEKFAGAVHSNSLEHVMPDGKAIQGPIFHHDGQNFAKMFGIEFLDKDGKKQYAWQNTWAITTRELGVMVATHGDDKGLILPPKVAPIQAIIVPIYTDDTQKKVILEANRLKNSLKTISVELDDREGYSPGWKFNEWELKGVPLRIEIGPKDIAKKQAVLVRRDTGAKKVVSITSIASEASKALDAIQKSLYAKAKKYMDEHVTRVRTYAEFKKVLEVKKGILKTSWCGKQACEDAVKEETGAKITNMPFDDQKVFSKCVYCGKDAKYVANFARSH